MDTRDIQTFRKIVWAHYKKQGRHTLPWRKTKNPYRILVSEFMLQQTQVERVLPYYERWMRQFPTVHTLADASLEEVLKAWQGLGYNRRAKHLHSACKELARYQVFPRTPEALEALPGVGPYTARAVAAFAFNTDTVCIETNIRTAVLHHFFTKHKKKVHDEEIRTVLMRALPRGKSALWYAALMDYGAYLKRQGVRLNSKTKGYAKQKAFRGSLREARGVLIKELTKGPQTVGRLSGLLGDGRKDDMHAVIQALLKEGMVEKKGIRYQLPS